MSRTDGRKVVGLACTAIIGALGLGLYLPYIADKDKIRGLFEEDDMPLQARQEMDAIMRQQRLAAQAEQIKMQQQQQQLEQGQQTSLGAKGSDTNSGSMWKNLRRSQQN